MTTLPSSKEIVEHVKMRHSEVVAFVRTRFDLPELRIKTSFFKSKICFGKGGFRVAEQHGNVRLNVDKLMKYQPTAFSEYARISKKRGTCSFKTTDWREWLDALFLHEVAHVVQQALYYYVANGQRKLTRSHPEFGALDTPHGVVFQNVYRILRDKFLNDRIRGREYYGTLPQFPDANIDRMNVIVNNAAKSPYADQVVRISGSLFRVIGFDPRKYKYPIIVACASGGAKKYKLSKSQFEAMKVKTGP